MPVQHVKVGSAGQGLLREVRWERSAIAWIDDVEPLDGFLEERDVFFWFQKQLDGLPSHKALRREGWDCGRCEGIVAGLQGVEASQRPIDERQRRMLRLEKKRIEVAADKTVEGSQFGWEEALGIPWRNVLVLFCWTD